MPKALVITSNSCARQIDWPLTGGALRDGSVLPVLVNSCGVLDRLPAFQYRYSNSKTIIDSPTTTLDDGGLTFNLIFFIVW